MAAALLYFDIRYFLLFWFVYWIFKSHIFFDAHRKLLRVLSFSNEIKMLAAMKKLGVHPEELQTALTEYRGKLGEEKWKEFERDCADIV